MSRADKVVDVLHQTLLLTFFLQFIVFLFIIVIGFYRSPEDTDEREASEKDGNPVVSDIQIWRSYSHPDSNGHTPRIALIADNSVQTRQIATDLAQQGYDVHHTTVIDAMFETVQTHPDDWDFMIFDLDLFDELEANVDELISFREDCSTLPVLLLSSSTSKDEFSDHRRAIGDATLRKPVFRNRLLIGIDAMKVNWEATLRGGRVRPVSNRGRCYLAFSMACTSASISLSVEEGCYADFPKPPDRIGE